MIDKTSPHGRVIAILLIINILISLSGIIFIASNTSSISDTYRSIENLLSTVRELTKEIDSLNKATVNALSSLSERLGTPGEQTKDLQESLNSLEETLQASTKRIEGIEERLKTVEDSLKGTGGRELVVSTTTSLYDTGLLDRLGDVFEKEHGIKVYFISLGTGLAIQQAQRGDADIILVHDPAQEETFLKEGYGLCRKIVAYNFFAIVGPIEDRASIRGATPLEAMKKIAEAGRAGEAIWVSRGDDSGTHAKEKMLWASIGFDWKKLREEKWYRESGTGMGRTLQIAQEFQGYTLTDIGTYLNYHGRKLIDLDLLVGQGKELLNTYSVIAVNPAKHPGINFQGALTFIRFLVSEDGQREIGAYGQKDFGQHLFHPAVSLLKNRIDPALAGWIEESAYIDGYECPVEYQGGYRDLYS